jgi:hypothetical protein
MKKILLAAVAIAMTVGAIACGNTSPGGHKILFSIFEFENLRYKLYTMNPDGSNMIEIYRYEVGEQSHQVQARLSDDGSTILIVDAYPIGSGVAPDFNYSLITMNADGANPITWIEDAEMGFFCMDLFQPQLSGDGSVLLYNQPQGDDCTSDLYFSGTTQKAPQVVYKWEEIPFSYLASEDGNTIIVCQTLSEQVPAILLIDRQTLKPVTVYNDPEDVADGLESIRSNRLYFKTLNTSTFTQSLRMLELGSGSTTSLYDGALFLDVAIAPDGSSMLYHSLVRRSGDDALGAGCSFPDDAFGVYNFGSKKVTNLFCEQSSRVSLSYSYDGKYVYSATVRGSVFNNQGQMVFENDEGWHGIFSPDSPEFLYWAKSDSGEQCLHIRNLVSGRETVLAESCTQAGPAYLLNWQ